MGFVALAELRALPDLDSVTKYPDAALQAAIDGVQGYAERELGTALEPTTAAVAVPAGATMLPWGRVTGVVDSGAVAVPGAMWAASGYVCVSSAQTLTVTYGFDPAPPLLRTHLMDEMRREVLNRAAKVRGNTLREVGDGGLMTVYSYADWSSVRPFGSPQLDTMLSSWSTRPPASA